MSVTQTWKPTSKREMNLLYNFKLKFYAKNYRGIPDAA